MGCGVLAGVSRAVSLMGFRVNLFRTRGFTTERAESAEGKKGAGWEGARGICSEWIPAFAGMTVG